jgi:hypothetical protein
MARPLIEILEEVAFVHAESGDEGVQAWRSLTPQEDVVVYDAHIARTEAIAEMGRQFATMVQEGVEALLEAFQPIADAIIDALRKCVEAVIEFVISMRRETLYNDLRSNHLPMWAARRIARIWPARFLPELLI